jgi:iron complex transport system substrate-binding protein
MTMPQWLRWLVLMVVGAALGCGASTPVPAPIPQPQRIASLTLATDELLIELVPLERMAGVTYLVDDPQISNAAGRYPALIPRLRDSSPERVLGLAPDLVCVAPYNSADFLKVLERSGLAVYRNEAYHGLDEIARGITALGERVGEPERARILVEEMRGRREQLAERLRGISRRPRVLYWSAGFTAGQGTTIDDIIREAGAINVAAERGLKGPAEIGPEQVIASDPEFILLGQWSADERASRIENHPLLRNLGAVRKNRVIPIEGRYLLSVSHHAVEGAEQLARRLHAERFDAGLSGRSSAAARELAP